MIEVEINRMILGVTLGYRVATESSIGEVDNVPVRPLVSSARGYETSIRSWLPAPPGH
jgi:hypothetical protein